MVRLVDSSWLRARLKDPGVTVVDARPATQYLSGYIPSALSVPVEKAFGSDGFLLADEALRDWSGRSGISSDGTIVRYGEDDAQPSAMLTRILGRGSLPIEIAPDEAAAGATPAGVRSRAGSDG
jgi:3-mercaptopyruvate sulfurtransferase SseA